MEARASSSEALLEQPPPPPEVAVWPPQSCSRLPHSESWSAIERSDFRLSDLFSAPPFDHPCCGEKCRLPTFRLPTSALRILNGI
eukprot:10554614-Karenia_brevis.AAC.1